MARLVVLLGRTEVPNGKELLMPQLEKRLSFHLDDAEPTTYYTYVILREPEGGNDSAVHYAKANVKEVGTGDVVTEWQPIESPGLYRISVYKQKGLLKGLTLRKVSTGSYGELVDSSSFRVLERGSKRLMDESVPEADRKYCSCIVQVAAAQSNECLKTKKWGDVLGSDGLASKCADPYEVCAKNLKRPSGGCFTRMKLGEMTSNELVAFALFEGVVLPPRLEKRALGLVDRQEVIELIRNRK